MPLVKVEKAMFEGLVSHFEHIFVLLTILKCDFVEVVKSLFQGAARQCGWICTNVPAHYINRTITIRTNSLCLGSTYEHYSLGLLLIGLHSHSMSTLHCAWPTQQVSSVSQLSLTGIYDSIVCGGEVMPVAYASSPPLRTLHLHEIGKAYPPTGARCDAGRTGAEAGSVTSSRTYDGFSRSM